MKKRVWMAGMVAAVVLTAAGCGNAADSGDRSAQNVVDTKEAAGENSTQMEADAPKASVQGISEEEAKEIAIKDAQVDPAEVTFMHVNKDNEDGKMVYQVEFMVGNHEYDYDVEIATGRILESDFDFDLNQEKDVPAGVINKEEAAKIILDRVEGSSREDLRLELDQDDGQWIYEGELHSNGYEYEMEVNGETGEIIEWKKEAED